MKKQNIFLLFIFLFTCGSTSFLSAQEEPKDTIKKVVSKFKTESISESNPVSEVEQKLIKKGDLLYSLGPLRYEDALNEYLKALQTNPDNPFLNFKVGYCYLQINKLKSKSVVYLEKAKLLGTKRNTDPKIKYYVARAYQVNHNMKRAIKEYKEYIDDVRAEVKRRNKDAALEVVPLNELEKRDIADAYNRIDECLNWMTYRKLPVWVKIVNLGDSINTEYPDYGPFISSNETMLLFTTRRSETKGGGKAAIDGGYYEDIYISKISKTGRWEKQ